MKYLIIAIVIFSTMTLNSKVVREHLLADNSFLKRSWIYDILQDSKGRIWVCDAQFLFYFDGEKWNEITIEQFPGLQIDEEYLSDPVRIIHKFYEDNNGNIIGNNNGGKVVFSLDSSTKLNVSLFDGVSYGNLNYASYECLIKHNKIYFTSIGLLNLEYNTLSKKYTFINQLEAKIPFPEKYCAFSPMFAMNNRLFFISQKGGLYSYNLDTEKWFHFSKVGNINFDSISYTKIHGCYKSPFKDEYIFTILSPEREAQLLIISGIEDSVIKNARILKSNVFSEIKDPSLSVREVLFLNEEEMLIAFQRDLIYYTKKNGFKKIPRPEEISIHNWYIYKLNLISDNEIWLSGLQTGIIKCNLDELLASALPVDVEIDRTLPNLGIFKIYPQPASENIFVDYYMQEGIAKATEVNIYDMYGNKRDEFDYDITNILNMSYKLRLFNIKLNDGVYILKIHNNNTSVSKTLIIN